MRNTQNLVDDILVHHPTFEEAVRRIEQCYTFARGASEPVCMALIGEARTGKSRALDTCWQRHPPTRLDDGMHVPILRVTAPSKPTVKGLAELMLEGLGAPDPKRGTENERTRRLKILMKETQTQMLMIDEFQHFYDKGAKLIIHYVADWLKILADDIKCALVVAGLPSCTVVIEQNEQLAGRFLAPVHLSRFRWNDKGDRAHFRAILRGFHERLQSQFDIPEFHADPMALRFYYGTGGLIGYLAKLLRQCVRNAVSGRTRRIGLEELAIAHKESMWLDGTGGVLRAFDRDFTPEPTSGFLEEAARVGTVVTPFRSTPRPTSRISMRSANACLATK